MRKNMKIMSALVEHRMSQKTLSKILGVDQPSLCVALNHFEFSNSEKADIVRKIKEYASSGEV